MNEKNVALFSELHGLSAYLCNNGDKKAQEVVDEAILKIDDYELLIKQMKFAIDKVIDENPKTNVLCDDGFTFSFQKRSKIHNWLAEASDWAKREGF